MTPVALEVPDDTTISDDGTVSIAITGTHAESRLFDADGNNWELPATGAPVQLSVGAGPWLDLESYVSLSSAGYYTACVHLDTDSTFKFYNALQRAVDHYAACDEPVTCAVIEATDSDGTPVLLMVSTGALDTINIGIADTSRGPTGDYLTATFPYPTVQKHLLPDYVTAVIPWVKALPIVDIALDTEPSGMFAILQGHDFPLSSAVIVTAPGQPAMWTGLDATGYQDLLDAVARPGGHPIKGTTLNGDVVELTVQQHRTPDQDTLRLTIHDATNDCLAQITIHRHEADDDVVAPMQDALGPAA